MFHVDAVHGAIAELEMAHRAYREQRERARADQRAIVTAWRDKTRNALQEGGEDLTDDEGVPLDDSELDDLLEQYLTSSQDDLLLPDGTGISFDDLPQTRQQLAELDAVVQTAAATLEPPHAELAARLRAWLDAVRADATPAHAVEQWPTILHHWRKALDLTTREAAAQLDISPAAIVRYEKDPGDPGGRTPKLPNIAAMVERMASVPPLIPHSKLRASVEAVTRLGGHEVTPTELIDQFEGQQAELIATVEDALPQLTLRQLQLLCALVTDQHAIEALLGWVDQYGQDPLRPLFDAAVERGVRGPADTGKEPS